MCTLERLQKGIYNMLRGISDIKFADVCFESDGEIFEGSNAEGLQIRILRPMPIKASKYSAGPTFSDVEIRIDISRAKHTSRNTPSLLTVCEIVSRVLHGWNVPLECGYGRLELCDNSPWSAVSTTESVEKITVRFRTQSVLQ